MDISHLRDMLQPLRNVSKWWLYRYINQLRNTTCLIFGKFLRIMVKSMALSVLLEKMGGYTVKDLSPQPLSVCGNNWAPEIQLKRMKLQNAKLKKLQIFFLFPPFFFHKRKALSWARKKLQNSEPIIYIKSIVILSAIFYILKFKEWCFNNIFIFICCAWAPIFLITIC